MASLARKVGEGFAGCMASALKWVSWFPRYLMAANAATADYIG